MEIFGLDASLFWFIAGVFLLALEAVTPGFFLLFFGLGAWVAAAAAFFLPVSLSGQLLIFMAVSVLTLIILRRKLKYLFEGRLAPKDKIDDPVFTSQYLGREVTIVRRAGPVEPGLAELNGTNWRARTEQGVVEAGCQATVERLEGLTLIVKARVE